jgi:glyoxylase-like metal-dependent hydrolase (beta-lactamase superfamily II)
VLVDSAHVVHAAQTLALVRHALQGQALREVVNTHLHSDHCGGNATLQRSFGCPVRIPPGGYEAVLAWDENRLSYRATGQRCERFVPSGRLEPGQALQAGSRRWQVLAAPGHDPDSVVLFDDQHGVLISADALWENGFGVVFPELDGEQAFDDVARVLDLIEGLGAHVVVPGHGAVFTDVPDALARARRRLAAFRAAPERHTWHAVKVLVKYHLMEEGQIGLTELLQWFEDAPLVQRVWHRQGQPDGSVQAFGRRAVADLAASGALVLRDGVAFDA